MNSLLHINSDWKAAHHNAAISLENREEKLDEVYNQIERNLDLLGATAIEDKLQVWNVLF
jgi:phospholipid-translocating ATPase